MEKIILFQEKQECCGCGACKAACPQNAIVMEEDADGFLYPRIQEDRCISCHKCTKACAYIHNGEKREPLHVYAAAAIEEKTIQQAASGGIFTALAKVFLSQGGAVVGAAMEGEGDTLATRHKIIWDMDSLWQLSGTKYMQSRTEDCFEEVRRAIRAGTKVLFSGTPCQVDAVKAYLGKEQEGLYTIDLVCHGVASERFFQEYLRLLEQRQKGRILRFEFRSKKEGWGLVGKVSYQKNKRVRERAVPSNESSYYTLFLKGMIQRENCYSCPYAGRQRVGDMTLGDYWGIETQHPEYLKEHKGALSREKGISLVLVNTKQGEALAELGKEQIRYFPSDFEKASANNGQLRSPCLKPAERAHILSLYETQGYASVDRWYRRKSFLRRARSRIFRCIPKRGRSFLIRVILKK